MRVRNQIENIFFAVYLFHFIPCILRILNYGMINVRILLYYKIYHTHFTQRTAVYNLLLKDMQITYKT